MVCWLALQKVFPVKFSYLTPLVHDIMDSEFRSSTYVEKSKYNMVCKTGWKELLLTYQGSTDEAQRYLTELVECCSWSKCCRGSQDLSSPSLPLSAQLMTTMKVLHSYRLVTMATLYTSASVWQMSISTSKQVSHKELATTGMPQVGYRIWYRKINQSIVTGRWVCDDRFYGLVNRSNR